MSTPDITPAQIVGLITTLLSSVVVLFKLDLSEAQQAAAVSIAGVVVAVAFMVSDALIRRARTNIKVAEVEHLTAQMLALPPDKGNIGARSKP